ncbi:MAG: hexokinase [Spirochaetales bacterium]|nr:hexokinase [Spirochaetales bacterium]
MKQIRGQVIGFLKAHNLYYADISPQQVTDLLLKDMQSGLEGKTSSLKMIPTYIQAASAISPDKPVIVLDAGGTHLRIAQVHFDKKLTPRIDGFKQHPMPGTQGKVDKDQFFQQLAEHVAPIIDISDHIGFCFSYPTEILPSKDGKLLFFSKEIETQGIEGELIGENLLQALDKTGRHNRKRIVILNDTVATLLAARAQSSEHSYGTYIGFILGTGLNCCYSEKNSNITKVDKLDPLQTQIINTEVGGFDKCPRGDIDKRVDNATDNPGLGVLEKMISGAYFGELCRQAIKTAVKQKLFSAATGGSLATLASLSTKQVNDFLLAPHSKNSLAGCIDAQTPGDRAVLYYLLDFLVERSAKLVAAMLSGMIIKNPPPKHPCHPVCISAEGSTFFKLKGLKARVECYLRHILQEQYNLYFEFVQIENAPLIGAAIAGLTN